MSGPVDAMLQLDGEWAGHIPSQFSVEALRLRVIALAIA